MQPTAIDSKSKHHPNERVAFIQACWHKEIVDQSRQGFVTEMPVSYTHLTLPTTPYV